jgi:hypothetical protein
MITKHKKIYNQDTTNVVCTLKLNDDYSDCVVKSSVTINVLANDTGLVSPVVTISLEPTKGTVVVNLNNTVTYSNAQGLEGESDFFQYLVTDGQCVATATVFIFLPDELVPLPVYQSVTLNKNVSQGNACAINSGNAVTQYIDTSSFTSASNLYQDINGLYNASYGYYTNGGLYRLWDGFAFIGATTTC